MTHDQERDNAILAIESAQSAIGPRRPDRDIDMGKYDDQWLWDGLEKAKELLQAAKREPVSQEAMAKDAERYRFLRSNCSGGYFKSFSKRFQLNCDEPETEWDAAIDAHLTTPRGG